MKRLILIAAFLCGAPVAHAAPMPTMKMDALLFSSVSVVEGPIIAAHHDSTPISFRCEI